MQVRIVAVPPAFPPKWDLADPPPEGADLNALLRAATAPQSRLRRHIASAVEFVRRDIPAREQIVEPFLPTASLSMIFAARGVGKTWFALCLSVAISHAAGHPADPTSQGARRDRAHLAGAVSHWTGRAMAKATGLSLRTVQRIRAAHKVQPHRIRTFKRSTDPDFAVRLDDVVGLYMNPPRQAVVVSIDEKSQIQALDRTRPGLPMKPGRCATMTHEAQRHHHPVRRHQRP